jgi:hypothetical protein
MGCRWIETSVLVAVLALGAGCSSGTQGHLAGDAQAGDSQARDASTDLGPCTSAHACPGGQVCLAGVCGTCTSDSDCSSATTGYGAGYICAQSASVCLMGVCGGTATPPCPAAPGGGTLSCENNYCACPAFNFPDYYVDVNVGSDTLGGGSSACPFKSITHTIQSIQLPGATIHVAPGNYTESTGETFPLYVQQANMTIVGSTNGTFPYGPVISGPTTPLCNGLVYLDDTNVALTSLALTYPGPDASTTVFVSGGGVATITDCRIYGNTRGGGLFVQGTAQILGTTITGNATGVLEMGRMLTLDQDGSGTATHLDGNLASGLEYASGTLTAKGGTSFDNNGNAGIYLDTNSVQSQVTLSGCDVSSNPVGLADPRTCPPAPYGCGWSTIQNTTFNANTAAAVEITYHSGDGPHQIDLGGGGGGSTGSNQLNAPSSSTNRNGNYGLELVNNGSPGDLVSANNDAWSACPPTVSTTPTAADVSELGGPITGFTATGCTVGK